MRDLEEVRELGAYPAEGPTADQVKLGLYWAYDGARLLGTAAALLQPDRHADRRSRRLLTPELARLLALCNIAWRRGIVCWEAKYRYQVWRPVIGVQNALSRREPDWRPFGAPRTNPTQFALGSDAQRLTALSMLGGGECTWFGEPVSDVLPYDRACFTRTFRLIRQVTPRLVALASM